MWISSPCDVVVERGGGGCKVRMCGCGGSGGKLAMEGGEERVLTSAGPWAVGGVGDHQRKAAGRQLREREGDWMNDPGTLDDRVMPTSWLSIAN